MAARNNPQQNKQISSVNNGTQQQGDPQTRPQNGQFALE